jgi:hypothetical protein
LIDPSEYDDIMVMVALVTAAQSIARLPERGVVAGPVPRIHSAIQAQPTRPVTSAPNW